MVTSFLFICLFLLMFGTNSNTMMLASSSSSSNVTCIKSERQALFAFKQILTDEYNLLSTWRGVRCCEWKGVACDRRDGHVVKLDLRVPVPTNGTVSYNDKLLGGTLSPSLQNLKRLRYLDLSMNSFSGNIPKFLGSFKYLEYLNLSCSGFQGVVPRHLGNLSRLHFLDLGNSFVVENSEEFAHTSVTFFQSLKTRIVDDLGWVSRLSSLRHLDLSGITIGEHVDWFNPICTNIGSLSRLENLYLQHNQLSENVPVSLGQLSNLKNLHLSYNSLVGVLSEKHFTKLKNLNYLDLSSNSLALSFSSQWIPPFQLNIFYATSCNIGPRFPNWIQTQTKLQMLDLSNSSISDTIPVWFDNIMSHILHLDLSNNQIGGQLPRLQGDSNNLIEDRVLYMYSNKFEGTVATYPSNVMILDLSDNLLSGHFPQIDEKMNPRLEIINLSKNRFRGSVLVHLCGISSIQVLDLSQNMFSEKLPGCLGNLSNLSVLDLSQNNFSGMLPGCLGNLIGLSVIDVANNNISGVIPDSLGSLVYLISLHLQNNIFEGGIPGSLQNLIELVTMDLGNNLLTGNIPFWIGEKLSNLRMLNLQSNQFKGKIPRHLCQLGALQYLNLAHNSISGMIPRCFGNLSGMKITPTERYYTSYYEENIWASMKGRVLQYTNTAKFLTSLDLSSNNISGEIPNALMNLVGLKSLSLSGNFLQGQIPMSIGNLKQLKSLDLSINNLSGKIPHSLTNLNSLTYLNLSFNSLSGPIPVGNQIQTLDDPSIYEGNNELCGSPILRSCNGNDVLYNHVDESKAENDTEDLWFYAGMGPGFAVGFIGLLGSLHFIRNWRVLYFGMLESVYGWLMVSIILNLARLRRRFFTS